MRSRRVWAWALLAGVPPDALASAMGWDMVDPGYLGTMVAWWPVDTFLRLCILKWLLTKAQPSLTLRRPWPTLPAAINAEALLSVRSGIVGLLGLIPAIGFLALAGIDSIQARIIFVALCGLGLIPAFIFFLRRSLAPQALLRGPLCGAEALDWSRDRLAGHLLPFLKIAGPWWALSLSLDGLGWVATQMGPASLQGLAWFLDVPSLIASLLPIALFVAHSETL